jgi:uncharacterized membrane protein YccF (DUF307 family)
MNDPGRWPFYSKKQQRKSYFHFMNLLGNIVWLIFGGLLAAMGYFIGGLVLCLTIVGIPWGLQCFKLAGLVLWPFEQKVISDSSHTGCLSTLCNIIWIIFGGWYTALIHILMGFILFISIIGIPWARQHFKLVEVSLAPFGKRIVPE